MNGETGTVEDLDDLGDLEVEGVDDLDRLDPDLGQDYDVRPHHRGSRSRGRSRLSPRPHRRPAKAPGGTAYPDVYGWVEGWLSVVYAHKQDAQQRGWKWCPQWFRHPEAVARLEAAWRAWENLRLDAGTGASVWFRDHGDPCMRTLTDPDGLFARCSPTDHQNPPDLRTAVSAAELRTLAVPGGGY